MRLRVGVCGGANARSYAAIEDASDVHGPCFDRAKLVHRVQGLDVDLDLTIAFAEATQDTGDGDDLGPRGAHGGASSGGHR